ncbi:hypothetical protein [Rhizobium leguminosarum]|uniref:hypothetical protein n=1 Tax=Rhizobium leguminosarum TaxID=384 RepID=UPI001030ABA4|nr:hypothetical protein [Rhizobium leguminosarum]TAY10400.1 hypothetical protein ELH96_00850 [Rhizobium leguminosarum]
MHNSEDGQLGGIADMNRTAHGVADFGNDDALPFVDNNGHQEWRVEKTNTSDGVRQDRIRHMTMPRFSVRLVRIDPFENCPVRTEGSVDVRKPIYRIDHQTVFCEIDWTDELPEDQHLPWLNAARKAHTELRGYFDRWKSLSPVKEMAGRIELDIGACRSWSDYTETFCGENDRTEGALVNRVRRLAGVVSTGELPVLLAMLHAADYSRAADELAGESLWSRLDLTYGDCAEAVGLAIMRQ